jgi:hypothetical protein
MAEFVRSLGKTIGFCCNFLITGGVARNPRSFSEGAMFKGRQNDRLLEFLTAL